MLGLNIFLDNKEVRNRLSLDLLLDSLKFTSHL